ncbi:hypothetical protein B7463_g3488, partial [Scytalidium lignicola]
MNQDLKTNIPVNNNNEQQPEEDFEEGSEEESEEGFEETIKEINIQEGVLKEVVILLKQFTKSTEGLTVEESSKVTRKKSVPPLLKFNLKPVLRALSSNLDPDSKLEDDIKPIPIMTLKEVKITRPDLFYKNKKKLKVYLA